jgi:hypothetical protein
MPKTQPRQEWQNVVPHLAMTLSPILIAVAVFCLTVMGLEQSPQQSIIDEIFGVLGLVSLFSAALSIDSILDDYELGVWDRFRLMKGGYFAFTLVVGAMSASILLLYYAKAHALSQVGWSNSFIPFVLTGLFIVCKLMSHKDNEAFTVGIIAAIGASIFVL